MILGLHHAAMAVPDIQKAVDFYCGVVGFEVVMDMALPTELPGMAQAMGIEDCGCQVRMIKKGNSCIELFEFKETSPGDAKRPVNLQGITHFALVSDDFQSDFDHLAANGVEFNTAPFGASPNLFAYGRDPFGNVVELLEHAPGTPNALEFPS